MRAALLALLLLAALPADDGVEVRALSHPATFGYDAAELRDAYAIPSAMTGAGTSVAIVTWGPASQASFDAYADANGLPRAPLHPHGDCSGPALSEWDLDAQMVRAAAPGAEVHVYCAPRATFAALLDALRAAVADDVTVISLSWGACELRVPPAVASAYEVVFADAASRGIAVFAASGDGGSRECDDEVVTMWPATSPHVVAVGGTRLEPAGASWDETAWTGSGGGASRLFAAPRWLPAGARPSPDVAAVADRDTGVEVHAEGRWLAMGGTSAAAPLWAGAWAGIVATEGRLHEPGPLLAQVQPTFRDVTAGSNGDLAAGPGRDLVTGWGALQAAPLRDALALLPETPRDIVAARGPGRGEVSVSWASVAGADAYLVLRDGALVATVASSSFLHAGLPDGAAGVYRVAAVSGEAVGPAGVGSHGRAPSAPGAPVDVRALPGLGVVHLSWSKPSDDGGARLAYEVRRDGAIVGWTESLAFEDVGCAALRVCAYDIRATNVAGPGPWSGRALAPALALP